MAGVRHDVSLLGDVDLHLFNEGTHADLASKLGAHPVEVDGRRGTVFAVWAPNAAEVSVVGDFNRWDATAQPLRPRGSSGIWEGFVDGVGPGERYKYRIVSHNQGHTVDKADPFAFHAEVPPRTASVVADLEYQWGDRDWMNSRARRNRHDAPISIYELHLGSWMRTPDGQTLSYRSLAERLGDHCEQLGFTHVELLPVTEHPFDGSWGYQATGYFAPTSRFGSPQDFMWFVDHLHQRGIGVILDWVPSHFPSDEHGLAYFDGTHLYEHEDPRLGFHPDWASLIFNYGRHEVRSFLLSSAVHWLDTYHIDGLRVDAVASMLYLDYSRKEGEWIPNPYGGNENLDAISFLRQFNETVYSRHPDVQTYAEESTAWPMVSRPVYVGGLGFGFKWDMGFMHDTLDYISKDPIHRRFHHDRLTFRGLYMFTENYVLPLSHDEVVHGKGSLLAKAPGDTWQQFANLRLLYAYMWAQPGKKLLFMGSEFGQGREWNHDQSLDWHQLEIDEHRGVQRFLADLNRLYAAEPAMHTQDCVPAGFEWVDANDSDASVISFLRKGTGGEVVLVVCNFTPVVRRNYRIGVPIAGTWQEIANSDRSDYGGSGVANPGDLNATEVAMHGRDHSLTLDLPPLGAVFLRPA